MNKTHHMRSITRKNGVLDALYGGNLRNQNIDGTLSAEVTMIAVMIVDQN
jgi:hypothetical protein